MDSMALLISSSVIPAGSPPEEVSVVPESGADGGVAPEVGVDPDVGGVAEPEVVVTVPVAAVVSPGFSTAFVVGVASEAVVSEPPVAVLGGVVSPQPATATRPNSTSQTRRRPNTSERRMCASTRGYTALLPYRRQEAHFKKNRTPELPQVVPASLPLPISSWQMRTPSMASVLQESAPTKSQMSLSMVPPPSTIGGR
jgi:hypothetical protein